MLFSLSAFSVSSCSCVLSGEAAKLQQANNLTIVRPLGESSDPSGDLRDITCFQMN